MHHIALFSPMCTWIRTKEKLWKLENHEKRSEVKIETQVIPDFSLPQKIN